MPDLRFLLLAPSALVLVSCAGDGVVTDATPPISNAPTLSALQTEIFTPRCAKPTCHAGPQPQQGMDLSTGQTYVHTVNVDAVEAPFKRVQPGNAVDSFLYMKISNDPRAFGRMPADGTVLSQAEIDAVGAWIEAGAKND